VISRFGRWRGGGEHRIDLAEHVERDRVGFDRHSGDRLDQLRSVLSHRIFASPLRADVGFGRGQAIELGDHPRIRDLDEPGERRFDDIRTGLTRNRRVIDDVEECSRDAWIVVALGDLPDPIAHRLVLANVGERREQAADARRRQLLLRRELEPGRLLVGDGLTAGPLARHRRR
jgi:hypothetical protein